MTRCEPRWGLTPADSFLWLMLFALENDRNGFAPSNLDFLRESYATGPLEGWISLRRNRLALAVFPSLDAGTQNSVVAEFAAMVDSGFIDDAKFNLTGIGWTHRDRLLASLARVDAQQKYYLLKRLLSDGMQVSIPGVEADVRPWFR